MQKVIRSRKNCSSRLIIPNIRNLQYFGLYCQYSASIPVYHQDLWGIYVRENSFFAGFITHSPTISTYAYDFQAIHTKFSLSLYLHLMFNILEIELSLMNWIFFPILNWIGTSLSNWKFHTRICQK